MRFVHDVLMTKTLNLGLKTHTDALYVRPDLCAYEKPKVGNKTDIPQTL